MEYKKVNTDFWFDLKLRCCSLKAKLTALYLLSSVHRRSEALFRIPTYYIAGDLNLSPKEVENSLAELEKVGFLVTDSANQLILIEKLLQHQINHKQQQAAVKRLKAFSESPLFDKLYLAAQKYNPEFAQCLKNNLKEKLNLKAEAKNSTASSSIELKYSEDSLESKKVVELDAEKMFSDQAVKLTEKLIDLILANNKRAALPPKKLTNSKFKSWVNSINKLHQLGPLNAKAAANKGYSWQEIECLIEFSQQNQFWKNNILSAQSLRKQIIKLENQLQSKTKKGFNKMEMLAQLYAEAAEEEK